MVAGSAFIFGPRPVHYYIPCAFTHLFFLRTVSEPFGETWDVGISEPRDGETASLELRLLLFLRVKIGTSARTNFN